MSLIERPDDPEQEALKALKALRHMNGELEEPSPVRVTLAATTAITHALLEVAAAMRETAP